MCCLVTVILVLGARLGIIYWWLTDPARFNQAFQTWVLPQWLWGLLGLIFLPWTTLAYLFVFPGGITGTDWIWLAVGLLIDLAGHGGSYRHRNRIPRFRRR